MSCMWAFLYRIQTAASAKRLVEGLAFAGCGQPRFGGVANSNELWGLIIMLLISNWNLIRCCRLELEKVDRVLAKFLVDREAIHVNRKSALGSTHVTRDCDQDPIQRLLVHCSNLKNKRKTKWVHNTRYFRGWWGRPWHGKVTSELFHQREERSSQIRQRAVVWWLTGKQIPIIRIDIVWNTETRLKRHVVSPEAGS